MAVRKYRVTLQETHPLDGDGFNGWEIRDVIGGPKVTADLEAESLDELADRIQDVFIEQTDWDYASPYVRLADGGRKPNGFARRFEGFKVLRRGTINTGS